MLKVFLGLLLSVSLSLAAVGEEVESGALAVLRAAVEKAATDAETRHAYTLDHWSRANDGEPVTFRARFDPRWPEGEQWRLVGQAPADIGDDARKMFKRISKSDRRDNPLIYKTVDKTADRATLKTETDRDAVFVAPVVEDGLPASAVETAITLDKIGGYISRIDVRATDEFKPNALVKIRAFSHSQTYAPTEAGGPAFLRVSETAVSGKAMFKAFKSETRETYLDIEAVDRADAAPIPEGR